PRRGESRAPRAAYTAQTLRRERAAVVTHACTGTCRHPSLPRRTCVRRSHPCSPNVPLFRRMASATLLVGLRCGVPRCMQRFAAHSASGLRMPRDEGPPEDDLLDREPPSPDEMTRYAEQSVVQSDGAHDGESPPSMASKRRARGTDSDAQDTCTKPEAWIDAFRAQCTGDLRDFLYHYTARLLSGARKVSADSSAAQDLVHAAVFAMLNGPDHWDFGGGQELKVYLMNVIKRQV